MCGYFCIGFADFILKGKNFVDSNKIEFKYIKKG